jgi:acyl CoA:acetate/3-ketoacid CoA transferase beta subunit
VLDVEPEGLVASELAPGVSFEQVREAIDADVIAAKGLADPGTGKGGEA